MQALALIAFIIFLGFLLDFTCLLIKTVYKHIQKSGQKKVRWFHGGFFHIH